MKTLTFDTPYHTYTSTSVIGEGGAGRVYSALDEEGREFAIKLIFQDKITKENKKRLRNEVQFCLQFHHPNIIQIIEDGIYVEGDVKRPFYVMRRYHSTLREQMKETNSSKSKLELFFQILDGVEAAHLKGVWHRDLKPENVLYDKSDSKLIVSDFGIAHFTEDFLLTQVETKPNQRLANFLYSSPEQKKKNAKVDQRSDIFSLGLMLNELFTGEIPYGHEYKTIAEVDTNYEYLDQIVAEMTRQDIDRRPRNIESVKKLLRVQGNLHLAKQELSALEKQVVESSTAEDKYISNPVKIINMEIESGKLILTLDQCIDNEWLSALHSLPRSSAVSGYSIKDFTFQSDIAFITLHHSNPETVQKIVNSVKDWLGAVPKRLQQIRANAAKQKIIEDNRILRSKIEAAKTRENILKNVQI